MSARVNIKALIFETSDCYGFVFISFLNSQLCSIAACTKETKLNIKSVLKKLNPKVALTKLSGNNNICIKQLFTKPKNHVNIQLSITATKDRASFYC